jgi:hypothetical protein
MSENTNNNEQPQRRKVVLVPTVAQDDDRARKLVWAMLAGLISLGMHGFLIFLLWQIPFSTTEAASTNKLNTTTQVDEEKDKEAPDLTNIDVGVDPTQSTNFDVNRIEEVSVPGMVNPIESVGIQGAPEGNPRTVPAPPGTGGGTGGAPSFGDPGSGQMFGDLGGMGGLASIGAFAGRSGATRVKMVADGGGNDISEACVARGLEWLSMHQASDGHWSMTEFPRHAWHWELVEDPPGSGRKKKVQVHAACNCEPGTTRKNDVAATAFALLPFLAGGQTHKPNKGAQVDYSKAVGKALDWLMSKQGKDGSFAVGDLYAHGLCTIAMCEAYGMTSDPMLKRSAQQAMAFIEYAQDPAGGGWRYAVKTPGDLSVTGWQLMGLKSGQMAGLSIKRDVLLKAERFLDSCQTQEGSAPGGGYGYLPNHGATATMTAVGMLCRQYAGINPRNPALLKGVDILKKAPPGTTKNYYYEYYATQVMHHMGGDAWAFWNFGPEGKNGIRDTRIKDMDTGNTPKRAHQHGSWAPPGNGHPNDGGRIMSTSLSLLMLEVYYRHLPLYRRDLGVVKEAAEK